MPGLFLLAAVIVVPIVAVVIALALIGSSIALLAEGQPLVGRAR